MTRIVIATVTMLLTRWLARSSSRSRSMRKFFNAEFYLLRYSDVRESRMSPWVHYHKHGLSEDRQPRGDFDPVYYRAKYESEIDALSPFEHWILIGRAKGY